MSDAAFHCEDCDLDFRRAPEDPRLADLEPPFTVEGQPGVHRLGARGRVRVGRFVEDAACCPRCRLLALDQDLRAMLLEFGWQPPARAPEPNAGPVPWFRAGEHPGASNLPPGPHTSPDQD